MKGLLYKDMLMLRRQYRNMILIFLVFLVVSVIPGNNSYFAIYASFMLSLFSLAFLRADEMTGWNRYCDILPISGRTIVTTYYLEDYGLLTSGVLLYLLLSLIVRLSTGYRTAFLSIALLMTVLSFLVAALAIPLTLKFGSTKGPLVQVVTIVVVISIAMFIFNNGDQVPAFIGQLNRAALSLLSLSVTVFLVILSWRISVRIYDHQEHA